MVEELAQHLEDRYGELCASGLVELEATQAALEELADTAGLARLRPRVSANPVMGRRESLVSALAADLRLTSRSLRRRKPARRTQTRSPVGAGP